MKILLAVALIAVLTFVGCAGGGSSNGGGNGGNPALQSLQIKPAASSVAAGLTMQVTATGIYSNGSSQDLTNSVTWTSSKPSVASIANNGVLSAKAQGSVTITASSGSITGNTTVSVVTGLVVSIAVSPGTATIAGGTQQQFLATAKLTDGTILNVTPMVNWTITPAGIANISNAAPTQGLVTALTPTNTTTVKVTATCAGSCQAQSGAPSATASLTVTNATPTQVAISPTSATIGWGTQLQFTAIGTFSDNSTQNITNVCQWTSSSTANVFITSSSGLAIGKGVGGPATIKATFRSVSSNGAAVSVDLSNLIAISVSPGNPVIATGTTNSFTATGTFNDGSTRDLAQTGAITWSSSNTSFASITSLGVATGIAQGQSTITASVASPALSGSATLNVENASLQSISIAPASASIAPGTQINYTAIGTFASCPSCPFQQTLTAQSSTHWNSSPTSVATINNTGTAKALAAGSTTITAASTLAPGGITSNPATLTVTNAVPVKLTLTPGNTFIPPGAALQFSAIVTFSDNTTAYVTQQASWSSADSAIATVTNYGLATAQGQGKTTITAKFGAVSGSASLLVTSSTLQSIAISPANPKVAEGIAAQFNATGTFADGSTQDLTTAVNWGSQTQKIATIGSKTGVLQALSPGQTTITATFGAVTGTTAVTVTNASLTSITVSPASASIALGNSQQFMATGGFSDGSSQILINVNWSSSDTAVAIITDFGLATTSGKGTATISAKLNAVSGQAVLTVH
ncbi:MAG: Ig-like domain-containing protein [Acidobacteria bacterium]|nr:Ig-like domain-containing protein [Acidobacteriota bacterium]